MSDELVILKAIFNMTARTALTEDDIRKTIAPRKGQEKQIVAYNLCDGSRRQGEIAKKAGLDGGNFSKAITRWVAQGVLIKLGDGNDIRPLHAFPISVESSK